MYARSHLPQINVTDWPDRYADVIAFEQAGECPNFA
jgi:hypothetical protein